jgi:hypothetical protein
MSESRTVFDEFFPQRNYDYFVVEHEVQRVLRSHPLLVQKRS